MQTQGSFSVESTVWMALLELWNVWGRQAHAPHCTLQWQLSSERTPDLRFLFHGVSNTLVDCPPGVPMQAGGCVFPRDRAVNNTGKGISCLVDGFSQGDAGWLH